MHRSPLKLILVAFVLIIAAVLYWKFHSSHHIADEAYVAEPIVNVWNTTAQVRQLAAEIHWGEKVERLAIATCSQKFAHKRPPLIGLTAGVSSMAPLG